MNEVALEALVSLLKSVFEAWDSGITGDAHKQKTALYQEALHAFDA